MVVYHTSMEELPKNCIECNMFQCRLPLQRKYGDDIVKKKYRTSRHEDCKLMEIKDVL